MELKRRLYKNLMKFYPKGYRKTIKQLLVLGGQDQSKIEPMFAPAIILNILMVVVVLLGQKTFFPEHQAEGIVAAVAAVVLYQLFLYLGVFFKADKRRRQVEESLPDALQLMASNLKAGMTPFQSMKLAAREEFGVLKEEFDYATTKALGSESFAQALNNIGKRVNSPVLQRAMKLISSSLRSGGHLATMLEDLAEDIAETKSLKNELVTNTKTYSMFIMFTIIIGAPLLLAISIHFVKIVTEMKSSANVSTAEFGLEFLAGEIALTPEFLTKMALIILLITSLLACMLFGVIQAGKEKHGFKFAPMVVIASLIIFVIARILIGKFFAGMM